jgi:diacylglycerol kinase (ATP)
MAARLILNPAAGADEALTVLGRLNERLRAAFGDLDIVITTGPGDAEAAGARAAQAGDTTILVGGGDGTLNEVLNGVHDTGRLGEITFGIVPLGTGNDFAAAIGVPEDLDEAVECLSRRHEIAVDIGLLNDRVFVNVSAGGFIGEVSEAVTPGLKTVAGKLAYLIGGAQVLLSYEPVVATFSFPDGCAVVHPGTAPPEEGPQPIPPGPIELFAVCNSRQIGGGRVIAPEAILDDGWLDVCVIEAMPTLEFVALLRDVAEGAHLGDPRVTYLRARQLAITFDRPIRVNTDGQVLETSECQYRVIPQAARFLAASPFHA